MARDDDAFAERFSAARSQLRVVGGREAASYRQKTLKVEHVDELRLDDEAQFLVHGLLEPQSFCVVYGPSNSGKTFWAIDLAGAIASGQPWRGRKVTQGPVLHLALEGGRGAKTRLIAWRQRQWSESDSGVPYFLVRDTLDLLASAGDVDGVLAACEAIKQRTGQDVALIIVDTVARAMAGGNENDPADMTAFVRNLDIIRTASGACVMAIHHSGKDEAKGARGHSSLRAATDTEIELQPGEVGGTRRARVTKQRELEGGDVFAFRLKQVELDRQTDGRVVTSCVVEQDILTEEQEQQQLDELELGTHAREALNLVRWGLKTKGERVEGDAAVPPDVTAVAIGLLRSVWMRKARDGEQDTRGKAWRRALKTLRDRGVLEQTDAWVWLLAQHGEGG